MGKPRKKYATGMFPVIGLMISPDLLSSTKLFTRNIGTNTIVVVCSPQVIYSIGALSKSMYERMFFWLVNRINETLDRKVRN